MQTVKREKKKCNRYGENKLNKAYSGAILQCQINDEIRGDFKSKSKVCEKASEPKYTMNEIATTGEI